MFLPSPDPNDTVEQAVAAEETENDLALDELEKQNMDD
jgi:hypothetical protein